MAYDEEIKDRARALRLDGLSVSQIAAALGGVPPSTVRGWLRETPVPEWTRRPRAKDDAREQARELRLAGAMVPEIAHQLGVSRSSVSLWTRDLPRPEINPDAHDARLAGLRRHLAERRARDTARRSAQVERAAEAVGTLSARELLLAGAVAYWAEGSKSKPWRRCDRVVFTNSDPGLIVLFREFLRLLDVPDDRLRLRVSIHESADVHAAESYWADVLEVPVNRFQRPTLKRHVARPSRYNTGADYHSCLVMSVLRSAALYRQIEGMWGAVVAAATSSLGVQSRVV